ncbi:MAG: hypothetical protein AUH42_05095 [Gemmatimonadetes bacterium 13_1_40CM_70_11]|nr:MAG: hypothetical protein AUH42_05095 [Gemmatimonadetes bacterium 13_1_40CM_70_11]
MRLLAAAVLLLQGPERVELRARLDTLYSGDFATAAHSFAALAARDTTDPAPVIFHAAAYVWWAAAQDSAAFEAARIDSLLGVAIRLAREERDGGEAPPARDFWLATALGYRAREREVHGHSWGAAKDAKAMRDAYRRVLARDSTCVDCYLGLGVYHYGLARAGALARLFAKLIGLGSGDAETGIRYMRRVAHGGGLASVEATWVLAAALVREADRDPAGRAVLRREARSYVVHLAERYPDNPVFRRFLTEVPEPPAP